ncbi:MAG: hypothetical protein OXE94_10055 [Aestuariivita sp.]|nr:hypothetical protein [Aestuariivita sp.]MCY4201708.1 hypothetical protein [Aestuariivita sp.]MCY4289443.1 hypothetical protein [Aestuariivita sp.]MCY4347350.1 hypothetical protein [Aestuariivita sp.]
MIRHRPRALQRIAWLNPIGLLDQDDWTTAEVTDRATNTITALFYSSQAIA